MHLIHVCLSMSIWYTSYMYTALRPLATPSKCLSESLPSSYQTSAASIKLPRASNSTEWWECLDQSNWLLSSAAVSRSACFLLPWSTSTWPCQPPCPLFLTASIPWIYCIHTKIQQAVGKWIKCRNQLSTYVFNAALMHEVQIFVKLEKIQLQDKYNESQRTLRPQQLHRLKLPGANEIWNMPKDSVSETSWAPLHVRCLHNVQPSSGILCKHDRWFGIMLIPKTGCDSATFGLAKRNMQRAETKQLRSCLSSWPKSNSSKWNNTVYRWIVNAIGIAIVSTAEYWSHESFDSRIAEKGLVRYILSYIVCPLAQTSMLLTDAFSAAKGAWIMDW